MSDRQEWVSSWAPLCAGNVCFPTPGHIPRVWLRIPIKTQRATKSKKIKTSCFYILMIFLVMIFNKELKSPYSTLMARMDQPLHLVLRNVCRKQWSFGHKKIIWIFLNQHPARERPRRKDLDQLQKLLYQTAIFCKSPLWGDLAPRDCFHLKGKLQRRGFLELFSRFFVFAKKRRKY